MMPRPSLRHSVLIAAAAVGVTGCYVPYRYSPGPGYGPAPQEPAQAQPSPTPSPAPAPDPRPAPLATPPPPARPAAPEAAVATKAAPAAPSPKAGPSTCQVALEQASPLLVGWPAAERAVLEALSRSGGVAVEFTGCTLRVLPQCRPGGRYAFDRTTTTSDAVEVTSDEELMQRLPLVAASLEPELSRSGRLAVRTVVAGQARLEGFDPYRFPATDDCARATHVLGGFSVGAFALQAGDGGRRALQSAGDPDTCRLGSEREPHFDCRAPVQAFLWPVSGHAAPEEEPPAWSAPARPRVEEPPAASWPPVGQGGPPPSDAWADRGRSPPPGPSGTLQVDLLSGSAAARWDVYYDDEVICTTPCTRQLDPSHPLLLRARDEGRYGRRADRVQIPHLLPFASHGAVQVEAHPTSYGKRSTGIVFTSLGGMAAITGITLAAVGCSTDHSGMCAAGAITGLVGGLVTAGSISMIVDSMPHARFRVPGGGTGRVTVGPGGAVGTF